MSISSINQICTNLGFTKIKPNEKSGKDIKNLQTLANAVSTLNYAKSVQKDLGMLFKQLKPKTKKAYRKNYPDNRNDIHMIEKMIIALELTHANLPQNHKDLENIKKILEIFKVLLKNFKKLPLKLGWMVDKSKKAKLSKKIIDALKKTKDILGSRLSQRMSQALDLGTEKWKDLDISKINNLSWNICKSIEVKQTKPVEPPIKHPKPIPPKVSWLGWLEKHGNYSFRLGADYGDTVKSPNDTGLSPVIGGTLFGGGTIDFKLAEKMRLLLAGDMIGAYHFNREEKVFNDNFFRGTFLYKRSDLINFFIQLGFRTYANIRPTFLRPDQNMLIQSGGISYKPKKWLSVDFNETFKAGEVNYARPENPHAQFSFLGSLGPTFKLGKFILSAGVIGGVITEEGMKQGIVGGKFDAGVKHGKLGLNLGFYGINYHGKQSNFGLMLSASWAINKNIKVSAAFGPGEFVTGDQDVTGLRGGLVIEFGWPGTQDTKSSDPKPLLLEPISYMRNNIWQF